MISFPFTPTAVHHKHGAKILEVLGITHTEEKPRGGRSLDCWYFVCRIKWDSEDVVREREVAPWALCTDSDVGRAEINALGEAMMQYLGEHGTWNESGKHQGWYAHRKDRLTVDGVRL